MEIKLIFYSFCIFWHKNLVTYLVYTSRLYERVSAVLDWYKSGMSSEECFNKIYEEWNDHNTFDWCHTISNAMIVATRLLYGEGDYSKSICMAVQAGFDTDCNGATIGSILGITNGIDGIDKKRTVYFIDKKKNAKRGVRFTFLLARHKQKNAPLLVRFLFV